VVQPEEYADWGIPWDVQTVITGRALGREDVAQQLVDEIENQIVDVISANPQFEGKTAAFVSFDESGFWIFEPDDIRTQFLTSLGFKLPEASGAISRERANLLDLDVLVAVVNR